jgi:hypothetical protein
MKDRKSGTASRWFSYSLAVSSAFLGRQLRSSAVLVALPAHLGMLLWRVAALPTGGQRPAHVRHGHPDERFRAAPSRPWRRSRGPSSSSWFGLLFETEKRRPPQCDGDSGATCLPGRHPTMLDSSSFESERGAPDERSFPGVFEPSGRQTIWNTRVCSRARHEQGQRGAGLADHLHDG